MARPAKKIKKIYEGKISLYQRSNGPIWQCAFTVGSTAFRISTKTDNFKEASDIAIDHYTDRRALLRQGLPVVTRTFKSVAELAVKQMRDALEDGTGRVVFKHYIGAIENYLIPFFGSRSINSIDHAALVQYDKWRREQFGRVPAKTTVNCHNVALNRVFDAALERNFITQSSIPKLFNDGVKTERRPDFSIEDYRKMYRYMRKWCESGKQGKITARRRVLRDYVLFLTNTGIRHGTESYGISWKHIKFIEQEGVQYVEIYVNGKTGPRRLIARHGVVPLLARMASRIEAFAGKTLADVLKLKSDIPLLAMPDGTQVKDLAQIFENMLKEADLLIDPNTNEVRTLYSLRHTYATFALLYHSVPIHTLAKQMGTSVNMLERHYSHLTPRLAAAQLAGKQRAA